MNNQFNLNIKTPCTENFNSFSPTKKGGFCDSCTKEVIDFSTMNSKEIINYFETNKVENTCGRFTNKQLTTMYSPSKQKGRKISIISGIAFAFLTLFSFTKTQAQNLKSKTKDSSNTSAKFEKIINDKNITVKGVVSENGVPIPGVNIVLEGSNIGTTSDFDGNFDFPVMLKKGDVLVFSYIGFNSKKVTVQDENSINNVELSIDLKMDSCVLMGKVAMKKVYKSKKN